MEGRDCVLVGLVVPTKELTDITEGICTEGPGSIGMVCPLARCMTRGREPVGDLEDTCSEMLIIQTPCLWICLL